MMFRLVTLFNARLLLGLAAPLLLTQCALVGSALRLFTAPLRLARGLAREESSSAHGLREDAWLKRAREVERRGDYHGRPGSAGTSAGHMAQSAGN